VSDPYSVLAREIGSIRRDIGRRRQPPVWVGGELWDAMTGAQPGGGSTLAWLFTGRNLWIPDGEGAGNSFTGINIVRSDWRKTRRGAPYVHLDGATEALSVNNAAWQQAGTDSLTVWFWVNAQSVAASMVASSKLAITTNQRSWRLSFSVGTGFEFLTNSLGTAAGNYIVSSGVTPIIDNFYFLGGHWQASTLQGVYTANATDDDVAQITNTVGTPPASLFNSTAPLAIGTAFTIPPTFSAPWNGYISSGCAWYNGGGGGYPSASEVYDYMRSRWAMTRWLYQ